MSKKNTYASKRNIGESAAFNQSRMLRLLTRTKLAYDAFTFIYPSSQVPSFEYLSDRQREGWKNVVMALDSEPICSECGKDLHAVLCDDCEAKTK